MTSTTTLLISRCGVDDIPVLVSAILHPGERALRLSAPRLSGLAHEAAYAEITGAMVEKNMPFHEFPQFWVGDSVHLEPEEQAQAEAQLLAENEL